LISAGALPQTPLGELTALPRPLAVFNRPNSKGREGEGEEKERGGKGKGRVELPRPPPVGESGSASDY